MLNRKHVASFSQKLVMRGLCVIKSSPYVQVKWAESHLIHSPAADSPPCS